MAKTSRGEKSQTHTSRKGGGVFVEGVYEMGQKRGETESATESDVVLIFLFVRFFLFFVLTFFT